MGERDRERDRDRDRDRERQRENPKQIPHSCGAQHGAWFHDPGIMTWAEIKSWTLSQLSQPNTLLYHFLSKIHSYGDIFVTRYFQPKRVECDTIRTWACDSKVSKTIPLPGHPHLLQTAWNIQYSLGFGNHNSSFLHFNIRRDTK